MENYSKLPDGRDVHLFTLTNKNGMVVKITNYGAILVGVWVPDAHGHLADVTLGYDTLEGWLADTNYLGASIGRFGNRIAHGKFQLDGQEYTLAKNNSPGDIPCHLHGGTQGFNSILWNAVPLETPDATGLKLTHVSKDGEEGYPGTLTTTICYLLSKEKNELRWEAEAVTDAPTIVNLVHHTYWNLSGNPASSVNDHQLQLLASSYLPINAGLIPTGEVAPVEGTPLDFRKPTAIGDRVDNDFEALTLAAGYDHCWVLEPSEGIRAAARLKDPKTGRAMEVLTDQAGIQFYGGNFLQSELSGKGGVPHVRRNGLCLETQNFPDAPNQPSFPSAVLRPGETYHHKTIFRFTVE